MKFFTHTLFFLLLITQICFAQWYQQSIGWSNYLYSVYFTDANTGWVVGYDPNAFLGIIFKTTDGGTTWTSQSSGIPGELGSVFFTDANTGWIVGSDFDMGTILKTSNGGANWSLQSIGNTQYLVSVYFTDSNTGWAVGGNWLNHIETILKTTDGGDNWIAQNSGNTNCLCSVYFTDSNTGWAVGYGGEILKTSDGGINWTFQSSGTQNLLLSVYFTDAYTGWAVGFSGTILHTTNGGVPVELTSFTATTNGKEVILNWSTATELNNQGFEIQRSTEGKEFFTVGFVNGYGTTTEQQNYSYADRDLDNGKYYYKLKQVDYDGSYEYSGVIEVNINIPIEYSLQQNYPNPFNPSTRIEYSIPQRENVVLKVYDILGNEIETLVKEEKLAGTYEITWYAEGLPSGVYFYRIQAGGFVQTRKMILLK